MKRFVSCLFVLVGVIIFGGSGAYADLVVGSGDWQNWTVNDLNQNGKPYWDNRSNDGAGYNVGYYLTNSGTFSGATSGPGALPFWSSGYIAANDKGGMASRNFYFTGGDANTAALNIEVAGMANINAFGWYDRTQPGVLHEIFAGPVNSPTSATFTPSAEYGFYFSTKDGVFRTESALNQDQYGHGAYRSQQHFALFKEDADTYWLAMEDLKFSGSDKDYNDMIVKIDAVPPTGGPAPVPVPNALLLFAPALAGLAFLRRRRNS